MLPCCIQRGPSSPHIPSCASSDARNVLVLSIYVKIIILKFLYGTWTVPCSVWSVCQGQRTQFWYQFGETRRVFKNGDLLKPEWAVFILKYHSVLNELPWMFLAYAFVEIRPWHLTVNSRLLQIEFWPSLMQSTVYTGNSLSLSNINTAG